MRNATRRTLSFFLALVMVFSFAVPVLAAPENTTVTDHYPLPVTVTIEDGQPVVIPVKDLAGNQDKGPEGNDWGFAFLVTDCRGAIVEEATFEITVGGAPVATITSGSKDADYEYTWGEDAWHWGSENYGYAVYAPDGGLLPNTTYVVKYVVGSAPGVEYTNGVTGQLVFTTDANGNLSEEAKAQVYKLGCPVCGYEVKAVGGNYMGKPGVSYEVFKLLSDVKSGEYILSANDNGPGSYQQDPAGWVATVGPTDANGFVDIDVQVVGTQVELHNNVEKDVDIVEVEGNQLQTGEFFGVRRVGSTKVYVVNPWRIDDTVRGKDRVPAIDPYVAYQFNSDCFVLTDFIADPTATIRVNVLANASFTDKVDADNQKEGWQFYYAVDADGDGKPDDGVWNFKHATPVAGAKVGLYKNATRIWDWTTLGELYREGTTDAQGRIVFNNVPMSEVRSYLDPWYYELYDGGQAFCGRNKDGDKILRPMNTELLLPYLVKQISAPAGFIANNDIYQVAIDEHDNGKIVEITILNGTYNDTVNRIAGNDRYQTAVAIAKEIYGTSLTHFDGNKSVILAAGNNFPDALAGSVLTEAYEAPMLLTNPAHLNADTEAYIKATKATRVFILGGTSSIQQPVRDKLTAMGLSIVELKGADRMDTAVAVGDKLISLLNDSNNTKFAHGYKYDGTVFLANGNGFADALTASVPAADFGIPILLTNGTTLTDATKAALARWDVNRVIVVGGPNSVPEAVVNMVKNLTDANGTGLGIDVVRYYGDNRSTTSMAIAKEFYNQTTKAYVASGTIYPDALVGSLLGAKDEAPILLVNTDSVPEGVAKYIRDNNITNITILGGPNTVTENVRAELAAIIASN